MALWMLVQTAPTKEPFKRYNDDQQGLWYITLEEHYDPPAIYPYATDPVETQLEQALPPAQAQLAASVNQTRIDDLTENHIRIQVIAADPAPGALLEPAAVSQINDQIRAAIAPYPDRLRAFGFLPMGYPAQAAAELQRCVTQLGLLGALVDVHTGNETYYDDPAYNVLWEMAQDLDVPIYLHPTYPQVQDINSTTGRFKPEGNDWSLPIASVLATSGYGWHVDAGLSFLRMWLAEVFDNYPRLKIVMGHMGETIPYMVNRAQFSMGWAKPNGLTAPEAYAQNIWVTTSGFFTLEPFATLYAQTDISRIMVSDFIGSFSMQRLTNACVVLRRLSLGKQCKRVFIHGYVEIIRHGH